MNNSFITLTTDNIDCEHICCAFSDKKCTEGYQMKKDWLKSQFQHGYVFRRLDERAKVFIEYGPAETAWVPVEAPGYLMVNCLWVSGQYKGKGYGKALLQTAIDEAKSQGKYGLVTVSGAKKENYLSDPKWLKKQGFVVVQNLAYGYSLWVLKFKSDAPYPAFRESVLTGECPQKEGITVYYTNRCPFTEFHVRESIAISTSKRNLPLTIVKLETMEDARNAPAPITIFSMFLNGKFLTTDISVCLDSRFDKIVKI